MYFKINDLYCSSNFNTMKTKYTLMNVLVTMQAILDDDDEFEVRGIDDLISIIIQNCTFLCIHSDKCV